MRTLFVSFVLIVVATLGACGQGVDTAEWTEEVKLSDGRMIVISRRVRAKSNGFPNASRGGYVDYELSYAPLGVYWYEKASPLRVRYPTSFDIIDGVPYFVLEGSSDVCVNRPKTDYAAEFLKWKDGGWVSVPQSDFPVGRMTVNLFDGYWGHTSKDDARGLITWVRKAEEDRFNPDKPDTVRGYFEKSRICAYRKPSGVRTSW